MWVHKQAGWCLCRCVADGSVQPNQFAHALPSQKSRLRTHAQRSVRLAGNEVLIQNQIHITFGIGNLCVPSCGLYSCKQIIRKYTEQAPNLDRAMRFWNYIGRFGLIPPVGNCVDDVTILRLG